jgi:hypothetical protein
VLSLHHTRAESLAKLEETGRAFVRSRPAYAAARARGHARPSEGVELDPRPATQRTHERTPSANEYALLERAWLCEVAEVARPGMC